MPYNRIYSNKEDAIQAFGELYNIAMSHGEDGRQVLHRYFDEDGNVASLIGIYHYKDNGVGDIEIKDGNINSCTSQLDQLVSALTSLWYTMEDAHQAIAELEAQVDICCPPPERQFLRFKNVNGVPKNLYLYSVGGNNPTLYYSLDYGETFEDWLDDPIYTPESGITGRAVEVQPGEEVYIYGDNALGFSFSNTVFSVFRGDDKWECHGNIMGLLAEYPDNVIPNNNCFYRTFFGFNGLLTAPELPATELTRSCYEEMFYRCQSLEACPELSAAQTMKIACYKGMFRECYTLRDIVELPSTALDEECYREMFMSCNGLTDISRWRLPADVVFYSSYRSMFEDCTGLTSPYTEMPATQLKDYCYYAMFKDCHLLKACPKLPAKKLFPYCYAYMFNYCDVNLEFLDEDMLDWAVNEDLADYCYSHMFSDCTNLKVPMKKLPSVVFNVYCYEYMFNNCPNLKRTPQFDTKQMIEGCFQYMFKNCATLVTEEVYVDINNNNYAPKYCCREMFAGCIGIKATIDMSIFRSGIYERCFAGMYSGCTSLEIVDRVAFATTVAEGCYEDMFAYTKVVKPNPLPAEQGALDCYKGMFKNCSQIILIECQLLQPSSSFTAGWVENVTTSGVFNRNGATQVSDWTSLPLGDGVPVNWSIQ